MNQQMRISKRRFARLRANLLPYLLVLPALILIGIVVIYPLISNVFNSLQTDYRFVQQVEKIEFVGFKNYKNAWTQGLFQLSIRNSFIFTFATVALSFVVGFFCAWLLNEVKRGRTFYRVLIVLPWVISPVIAGYTWRWLVNDQFGFLNHALKSLGLIDHNIIWLGDQNLAFITVIIAASWRLFPFVMIMLLAGLQKVSATLLEAADIDGASGWQKFIHITLPQVWSVVVVILLLSFIWMFNDFGIVHIMTKGGPLNSTMVIPVLIRILTFQHLRMGTASALALILAVMLMTLSIVYLKITDKDID